MCPLPIYPPSTYQDSLKIATSPIGPILVRTGVHQKFSNYPGCLETERKGERGAGAEKEYPRAAGEKTDGNEVRNRRKDTVETKTPEPAGNGGGVAGGCSDRWDEPRL